MEFEGTRLGALAAEFGGCGGLLVTLALGGGLRFLGLAAAFFALLLAGCGFVTGPAGVGFG